MVPKGPRYSSGAFGLGSKVSRWLGAPHNQRSRIDLARRGAAATVHRLDRAKGTLAPVRRKLRRVMPWQEWARKLPMSSMMEAPEGRQGSILRQSNPEA